MGPRRNSYDVSNTIDTTDHASVNREVRRIFLELFPRADLHSIDDCFLDVAQFYRGEHPAFRACDTGYHDLQHIMEVALAMARLMDGYERSRRNAESIGPRLFSFGVMLALLHDVGYLRHVNDSRHDNGAQYTTVHVSRGARFVQTYMANAGMADLAPVARELIHFTGYERRAAGIRVPHIKFRLIGHMLGTADIIAQMADRCYLEKCRDRLFPEFVQGGLAADNGESAAPGVLFNSVEDLITRTPDFYRGARQRLDDQLGETYRYAEDHFEGQNLYIEEMQKNVEYATIVAEEQDLCLLRRVLK
jgi:hypothetical protein